MKVYNTLPVSLTIEVLLTKIVLFFFDHWSNYLFQSNQRFQAIEFVDDPFQKSSAGDFYSMNMKCYK